MRQIRTSAPPAPAQREQPIDVTGGEAPFRLFNELSEAGNTVCGAALMAGAAFVRNIFKLHGVGRFDKDLY